MANYNKLLIELISFLSEGRKSGREISQHLGLSRNQFYTLKERAAMVGIAIVYERFSNTYSINRNRRLTSAEETVVRRFDKLRLTDGELDKILGALLHEQELTFKPVNLELSKNRVKFGLISDTHIGSRFFRADVLRHAANQFIDQEVDFVLNCGDTTEGISDRPGHIISELDRQRGMGTTEQLLWMKDEFQVFVDHDIDVYSIEAQGSHGGWAWIRSNQGVDIGDYATDKSEAYKFLGFDEQDFYLTDNIKIRLRHPASKTKEKDYVNSVPSGTKPNMILEGHWHSYANSFVRNIHHYYVPCMQSQTPYMQRKGLIPFVGYLIFEVGLAEHGIDWLKHQLFPFYD